LSTRAFSCVKTVRKRVDEIDSKTTTTTTIIPTTPPPTTTTYPSS